MLPMSYIVQPKIVVHYNCRAKFFGFSSTNVAIFLYLVKLKIEI